VLAEEITVADQAEEEFRQLFEHSNRSLLAQAYLLTGDRNEAQDLVQETFLRAWRDWSHLAPGTDCEVWLRLVLHNLAVNRWRALSVRLRHPSTTSLPSPFPEPSVEHLDVLSALRKLPQRQRQAVVLVAILGETTAKAAATMRANEGSVRVWVSRGRASLARALGRDLESLKGGGEDNAAS